MEVEQAGFQGRLGFQGTIFENVVDGDRPVAQTAANQNGPMARDGILLRTHQHYGVAL